MCEEKILSKIKKLLELSNNTGATEAEAMSALTMAQKLMATHNVELADLEELQRDESNVVTLVCEHKWDAGYRKPLASVMAKNYRCKCYMLGNSVAFMGVDEDAKIAKAAFEFAYKFIMRRSNQEYERVRKEGYSGRGVINSYAYGFLSGLKEILDAQCVALQIIIPPTVENAFNEMTLSKGRGGMRTGEGIYRDIANIGSEDAKNQYSTRALNA